MRYFLFAYSVQISRGTRVGNLLIECETFPRSSDLIRKAVDDQYGMPVVITGWEEFDTEEDFRDFQTIED